MSLTATTEPQIAAAGSFSSQLKIATAEKHSSAESSSFITELMQGKLSAQAYGKLLAQYAPIYAALEEMAEHFRAEQNALLKPFILPSLDRLPSIQKDLDQLQLLGVLTERPEVLPATIKYAEAIKQLKHSPERFLAHHYLRYLGDLSGGQAIAALVTRHYGIPQEALSMYEFKELPKPKIFKDSYRKLLDEAPLNGTEQAALIDEALKGFDYNRAVFLALAN